MWREALALVAGQQVAVAGDRVERRPDLVREVREELALEPGGLLDLSRTVVRDLLGSRQLGREPIEILVLLARDLHQQRPLLERGERARGDRTLGIELLLEPTILREELLDSLARIGGGHVEAPKVSEVSVELMWNPQ